MKLAFPPAPASGLLLTFALAPALAFAQASSIIRGEVSAGVYENIKTDGAGHILDYPAANGSPVTWLASGTRTSTQVLSDKQSVTSKGIQILCNVTAAPGAETLQIVVEGKDTLSGVYYQLAANTATTATGLINVRVYPGITPVAASTTGIAVNDVFPFAWRAQAIHSAAGNWTYSCSYINFIN